MGVRKGQGYGVPKPKRARCPDCGKKGVTQWMVLPTGVLARNCQYCGESWTQAAWNLLDHRPRPAACPPCKGSGKGGSFQGGEQDGGQSAEWVEHECVECDGTGVKG